MSLAGISIRRPVATTMVMLSFIFIGLIAMFTMKSEMLPNMAVPVVTISTNWNGAVAEDVETQITEKIESILPKVEGIERVDSTSSFQKSQVVVRFKYGVNASEKTNEIQRELSRINNSLPQDATTPITQKLNVGAGDITLISMFYSPHREELSTFMKQYLKPKLESLNGVGKVSVFGNPPKQIQIQFDSDKLAAFNMTPMQLYDIIKMSSRNVPLGTLETGKKQYVARFMGELNSLEDLKNMIIKSNGNTLKLSDVATVKLTREDETNASYLSGKKAMALIIEKSADGSTVEVNKEAIKAIESLKSAMPSGTTYNILMDTSKNIKESIAGVSQGAIQGLILATIVLLIFLKNIRATLLISTALPVAIIFTFAFLSLNGTTINLVSLMGLSIGVGMLTDNSVVVVDNIYRHMTELHSPVTEAAENGAAEVTTSVIASALTTMVVFVPVLFIPGIVREIGRAHV